MIRVPPVGRRWLVAAIGCATLQGASISFAADERWRILEDDEVRALDAARRDAYLEWARRRLERALRCAREARIAYERELRWIEEGDSLVTRARAEADSLRAYRDRLRFSARSSLDAGEPGPVGANASPTSEATRTGP